MSDVTFIILGMSGDLAKKKLIPALYQLINKGMLGAFAIIGTGHEPHTVQEILERAKPYIAAVDEAVFARLVENTHYQKLDCSTPTDFATLAHYVEQLEQQCRLPGNRLVYCATASHFYSPITQGLAQSGLIDKMSSRGQPWQRIVYEKPFGHDLASAQATNTVIARYFDEQQVYRVDHYLTKEMIGNIALVRFTNCVFEPLWNNRYIENVQIIVSEKIGIENRGAYYDAYGALKDIVQNHVLEMLALIGMEAPEKLTGEHIRAQRAKVLEKVRVVDALLGQYQGYQQEKMVAPTSRTETFAAAYLAIDNERWAGVPFFIKTGKYLDKKETVIHIKFKQVNCLLTQNCPSDSNYLTIQVAPDSSFFLSLNAKKPGEAHQVVPVKMEFCHSCLFTNGIPEAYEVIVQEVMRGEHAIAVRFDEIESSWKVIEAIKALPLTLYAYEQGSTGPDQMNDFCTKHGFRWRS
jgi:glucose-6-phosphate 1-dehydrogenase